jgi:hypothetical protein
MQTDTSYLGIRLDHPFIAGASPFGYRLETVKRLEDGGCAAIVLHSLYEEQITQAESGRVAHPRVLDRTLRRSCPNFPIPTNTRWVPTSMRSTSIA